MRTSTRTTLAALTLVPLAACVDAPATKVTAPAMSAAPGADPGVHRQYGVPQKFGNGHARTYVVLDAKRGGAPVEVGVALDEGALAGLPEATGPAGAGHHHHKSGSSGTAFLAMPAQNPTQFQFVELNWNPSGHPPAGVYGEPHFDYHFWMEGRAVRDAIDPADPAFAAQANSLPAPAFVPQHNFLALPPGAQPVAIAVPQMGVHWNDLRSPELQMLLGNAKDYRPFTATFIYGSWDGRFVFLEPMITRAFLLERPDVELPVGTAAQVAQPGYYPGAYRVQYDPRSREYRVALTQLAKR